MTRKQRNRDVVSTERYMVAQARTNAAVKKGRHLIAAAALLLAPIALAACGSSGEAESTKAAEERPSVLSEQDVATATRTQLTGGVVLTGSLQPAWQVSVKAQVPGTIGKLSADRGTRVSEGQVLATIEAEGIRGQAEGARAGVAAAQANLALAKQRLESAKTLSQAGAMSAIDFQAAQANYEAAEAQLAAARAQAAGAVEQAARATVRAPITGVVNDRMVEQGEAVNPGQELFKVVRSDVLELSGQVPVDAAAQIRVGQPVVFTLSAQPMAELRGEVARIEPMANTETRQVGVYLRLRNPGGIIGGQFATGRVIGESKQEAIVLPEVAIRSNGNDRFVYVVKDGRVNRRAVTLGPSDPSTGNVAIASGVEAGEQVISTPSVTLQDGARVQVGAAAAAPAAAEKENH